MLGQPFRARGVQVHINELLKRRRLLQPRNFQQFANALLYFCSVCCIGIVLFVLANPQYSSTEPPPLSAFSQSDSAGSTFPAFSVASLLKSQAVGRVGKVSESLQSTKHESANEDSNDLSHDKASINEPLFMMGVMMMDTPFAVVQRRLLRIIYAHPALTLRFVICRPIGSTTLEDDVVSIDMEETDDFSKTLAWFQYALQHRPPSVRAVFQMDMDDTFCFQHLYEAVAQRAFKDPYVYYGKLFNHIICDGYEHCPPLNCIAVHAMTGHCWYYMGRSLFGVSTALLETLPSKPEFAKNTSAKFYADLYTGMWVNQSIVRTEVVAQSLDFSEGSSVVDVSPPTYPNYVMAYAGTLALQRCRDDLRRLLSDRSFGEQAEPSS